MNDVEPVDPKFMETFRQFLDDNQHIADYWHEVEDGLDPRHLRIALDAFMAGYNAAQASE